ncbi:MAG: PTS sugar transporter subunit IIA [Gammaproteobacteria bacterium]|nr:PTS sugar transporter subunit IIA [Gammaproteobacteria bacterium]
MIDFRELLLPSCTRAGHRAASKKAALEHASEIIAGGHSNLEPRRLLEGLLARERLGNTCLGDGVALPHCRMPCDRPVGALLRLAAPLEFEAPDGQPVDLLFVLVVPDDEGQRHLEILGALARAFDLHSNRNMLRRAENDTELRETLLHIVGRAAA